MAKTPSKLIRDPLAPRDDSMRALEERLNRAAAAADPQPLRERSGAMVRLSPAMARSFRILAAELDTTQQAMLHEAVVELLIRHNKRTGGDT